jgi:hypothetical protein
VGWVSCDTRQLRKIHLLLVIGSRMHVEWCHRSHGSTMQMYDWVSAKKMIILLKRRLLALVCGSIYQASKCSDINLIRSHFAFKPMDNSYRWCIPRWNPKLIATWSDNPHGIVFLSISQSPSPLYKWPSHWDPMLFTCWCSQVSISSNLYISTELDCTQDCSAATFISQM